jgi:hypothetical protein
VLLKVGFRSSPLLEAWPKPESIATNGLGSHATVR